MFIGGFAGPSGSGCHDSKVRVIPDGVVDSMMVLLQFETLKDDVARFKCIVEGGLMIEGYK